MNTLEKSYNLIVEDAFPIMTQTPEAIKVKKINMA
jgi:hypothetical protein